MRVYSVTNFEMRTCSAGCRTVGKYVNTRINFTFFQDVQTEVFFDDRLKHTILVFVYILLLLVTMHSCFSFKDPNRSDPVYFLPGLQIQTV